MTLDEALHQFELVEANLVKLDTVWSRLRELTPAGVAFLGDSPEAVEYRRLARDWSRLVRALPKIDGWCIEESPRDLNAIAHSRFEAQDLGEIESVTSVEDWIELPGVQLEEYRDRFADRRGQLIRDRVAEIMAQVDSLLVEQLRSAATKDSGASVRGVEWTKLEQLFREADRLQGSGPRSKHWTNLYRHLRFGLRCDLEDIAKEDWPGLKKELVELGFRDTDPLPVQVVDLQDLVAVRPAGPVGTALRWERLSEEEFERLVFAIISDAPGYENPEWLMRTNAPDQGRDLTVQRVRDDSLSGTQRDRVIIQCKHWLSKSVSDIDISETVVRVSHWEPPLIHELIVVTSGRFTSGGVRWAEQHTASGKRPVIALWPESHLERLLAARPHIVASFGLR